MEANRQEIERRFPKVMRRVSGYNLDEFPPAGPWNLAKLMAGSEGTLATLLEAKVQLEPLPRHTGICVVHFADLAEAIRAVQPILAFQPSAVEILDQTVLGMTRTHLPRLAGFIEGEPAAVLIVE
ncbi:MAG: FAD-binding oxidoreductase [Thermoanaerobaculales bacterium]